MKIDFTNILIKDIDGSELTVDISKDLGNILYKSAIKADGLDIARQLYNEGIIEVDKELASALKQLVEGNFLAVLQEAVIPTLNDVINEIGVEEIKDEQPTE